MTHRGTPVFSYQIYIYEIVTTAAQQPCAAAYQLWGQPCGCSIPALATALWLLCTSSSSSAVLSALLTGKKPSEHLESWRTQVYYAGGLRGDRSPESEPRSKAFMGCLFQVHAWLVGPEWWQGSRCGDKFTEADVRGRGGWGSWLDFA